MAEAMRGRAKGFHQVQYIFISGDNCLSTGRLFVVQKCAALHCTGYEPNAQLKGLVPCRGLGRVRCHLVEVDLQFYGWIKKANQGTEGNELDTMAETFGKEIDCKTEGVGPSG